MSFATNDQPYTEILLIACNYKKTAEKTAEKQKDCCK